MSAVNGFTPTQKRILAMLSDGYAHDLKSLLGLLDDELADDNAVRMHISNLRKKINQAGDDIVCRQGAYRLVRMIQR